MRRLLALLTLGLVASDDMPPPPGVGGAAAVEADPLTRRALTLLDEHDLPGMMERVMRDACRCMAAWGRARRGSAGGRIKLALLWFRDAGGLCRGYDAGA